MSREFNFTQKTEAKPKYKVGDKIGQLKVIEVLCHCLNGLTKKQWWYRVECSCGTVEKLNQSQLHKRTDCIDCMQDRRGALISVAKQKVNNLPDDVAKALRSKW